MALLNLFPLPREAAFLKSFAYAGECIDRGYSVLVFPEGDRAKVALNAFLERELQPGDLVSLVAPGNVATACTASEE